MDHDERRVVAFHDVSSMNHQAPGPAVNRRANGAVPELDLRIFNGGPVCADRLLRAFDGCSVRVQRRLECLHSSPDLFVLFAGNHACLNQPLVPPGFAPRVLCLGRVACQVGLGLL